jgi:hypothetical protein
MPHKVPPPEKGNKRALTHGAYARVAPEREDAKRREVFDALAADAPVRDADGSLPAADSPAVSLLAQTLVRLDDLRAYIDEHGLVQHRRYTSDNPQTKRQRNRAKRKRRNIDPLRLLEMEDKLVGRAERLLDSLGMTPRSRAKLGLDQARQFDLAREWEQQDRDKRRRGSIEGTAVDE